MIRRSRGWRMAVGIGISSCLPLTEAVSLIVKGENERMFERPPTPQTVTLMDTHVTAILMGIVICGMSCSSILPR